MGSKEAGNKSRAPSNPSSPNWAFSYTSCGSEGGREDYRCNLTVTILITPLSRCPHLTSISHQYPSLASISLSLSLSHFLAVAIPISPLSHLHFGVLILFHNYNSQTKQRHSMGTYCCIGIIHTIAKFLEKCDGRQRRGSSLSFPSLLPPSTISGESLGQL